MLKKSLPYFAALLINALLVTFVFYDFIVDANIIHHGIWGDGFKNFFTTAWYIKYDSGIRFSGMNFPFGENIIYTDNQPIVSITLKYLTHLFPSINDNIRGIITLSNIYSLAFAGMFSFGVLRLLKVPVFAAILFSLPITLMSPQIPRIAAHYSLAYACFIPLLFWFTLSMFEGKHNLIKKALALIIINSIFCFTHLYYLGIALFTVSSLLITYWLTGKLKLKEDFKKMALITATVLVPFILLKLYLFTTDPIIDRPQAPWGFIDSRTDFYRLFIAEPGLISTTLKLVFHYVPKQYNNNEGAVFIGTIPFLIFLASILFCIVRAIQKPSISIHYFKAHHLLLLSSVPILLYAMALPFTLPKMGFLFDYLPTALKQMRASGRFAWIFYYALAYFAVVQLTKIDLSLKAKNFLLFLAFSLWIWEGHVYSKNVKQDLKYYSAMSDLNADYSQINDVLTEQKLATNQFNGILYFPFCLIGSEKIGIESPSIFKGMKVAMATGLPLITGVMSRTSIDETLEILNLMSDDDTHKSILSKYDSQKALLLVLPFETNFSSKENDLISKATFIGSTNEVQLFSLPLNAFTDSSNHLARKVSNYNNLMHENPTVLYRSFDDLNAQKVFFGKGAYTGEGKGSSVLYEHLPNAKDSIWCQLSVWLYVDNKTTSLPDLYLSIVDEKTNTTITSHEFLGKFATNSFNGWLMLKGRFFLPNKEYKLSLYQSSDKGILDELLIKEENVDFVTSDTTNAAIKYLFNNQPVQHF